MDLSPYKAIAALFIFIASMATSLYLLKRKHAHHSEGVNMVMPSQAAFFLAPHFFHMLPDSIRSFSALHPGISYPIPELVCVGGFLLLLFLERISLTSEHARANNFIPYILALTLVIHALSEGAALGLESAYAETVMLFIAILAHKGTESFGLCVLLLRHALPYRKIFLILVLFSLMTPLGILFGSLITANGGNQELASLFTAFAAGTFLYISTLHHVHFHHHGDEAQGMLEFGALTLGVVMMGVIALWT